MLIRNSIFKVVLCFFMLVLMINLVLYTYQQWPIITDDMFSMTFNGYHNNIGTKNFMGFRYFFEQLSTFPGPTWTIASFEKYGNIINNFNVTDIWALDTLIAILRVVTVPVIFIITVLVDAIAIIMWFIEVFFPTAYPFV